MSETLTEKYLPLTEKLVGEGGKGLSAVQVAGGKYAIRDANARSAISGIIQKVDDIDSRILGGVHYIGRTDTQLSDGSTTNPVRIDGRDVIAAQGDMVSLSATGK